MNKRDKMRTFIYTFLLTIASVAILAVFFYIFLLLTWGMIISVETGFYISVFIALAFFLRGIYSLGKKNGIKKVIISIIVTATLLFPVVYIYIIRDNTKLYSYKNFPCKDTVVISRNKVMLIDKMGTSMDKFDFFTRYSLEDEYYYELIKKNMGHTHIKTYPESSKWKVLGLYEHTRYHLNYFLILSLKDGQKGWLYTESFNYKQCSIETLDRKGLFEKWIGVGDKKEVNIKL